MLFYNIRQIASRLIRSNEYIAHVRSKKLEAQGAKQIKEKVYWDMREDSYIHDAVEQVYEDF